MMAAELRERVAGEDWIASSQGLLAMTAAREAIDLK
jgi:hypothetical protein